MDDRMLENPFRAAVKLHDPLTLEHLREARRALTTYCIRPGALCDTHISLARDVARGIALLRLYDLRGQGNYQGLDAGVINIIDRIVDVYAKLLAGFLVTVGDDVMVKFKAAVELDGKLYRRGDITKLNIENFLLLAVVGLVESFESPVTLG